MTIVGPVDVIGDTHGNNQPIVNWVKSSNSSTLIHVGDLGAGFRSYENSLVDLGSYLNSKDKTVIAIRGNHDDPSYFDDRIYGGDYGGIKLAKDNTILNWYNSSNYNSKTYPRTILLSGGAVSVDRALRTEDKSYWKDENFISGKSSKIPINHIITHSAPRVVSLMAGNNSFLKTFYDKDIHLEKDLLAESERMHSWIDAIIDNQEVPPASWFYGHFHQSRNTNYRGISCTMLNINEITSLK